MASARARDLAVEPLRLIHAKLESFAAGFFYQLPNIVAAILLLLVAWGAGRLASTAVRRIFERRDRPDLGVVLGSIARGLVLILALLVAAAIVFPSVNPADILATLGIGSVAIGFAFKDILQNLFAGILLLLRRPYRRGDQIVVKEFEGTVEHVESRATLIRTYDGRRVVIPNSDIYTSAVTVNTAFPHRRDEYCFGVGYGDDPGRAAEGFRDAIAAVEGVLADPPAEVLPWELSGSWVNLMARWWADSHRANQNQVRARVVLALFEHAREKGIDLPFPTQVVLFHDQTEEVDGDRRRQREGWPAGPNPPAPRRP